MELGFNSKLAGIKPEPKEDDAEKPEKRAKRQAEDRKVDEIAAKHNFVDREPTRRFVRPKDDEPIANLNIRPPVSTFNRFAQWAAENRYSYAEALKELLDRASVK